VNPVALDSVVTALEAVIAAIGDRAR
jgi:hypothetical protein